MERRCFNGVNIAVMASGEGTNLQAIIKAVREGEIKANLKLVIGDVKDAYCLKRAQEAKIRTVFIDPERLKDRESFDKEVIKYLKEERIDLVVLAGFMRILSPYMIKKYRNKILNIHPALLPSFKGKQAIREAYHYGVKVTGITVHFVNEEPDAGPVILQEAVEVRDDDTLESLEEKIHNIEHRLYPEAIRLFCENKLKIAGRKVKILLAVLGILSFLCAPGGGLFAEEIKAGDRLSPLPPSLRIDKDTEISFLDEAEESPDLFLLEDRERRDPWEPLTEEEYEQRTREMTYSSAKAMAEFFDSIYMPYVSRGLFAIIGTAYRIDEHHQKVKKEGGLGIDYGPLDSEIYLIYEIKY
jgi:phosphoribosylglycinamide formyltransferase 1